MSKICYKPEYRKILGNTDDAVIVSQLMYWEPKKTYIRDGKMWIAKTYEELEDETGIPANTIRNRIKQLSKPKKNKKDGTVRPQILEKEQGNYQGKRCILLSVLVGNLEKLLDANRPVESVRNDSRSRLETTHGVGSITETTTETTTKEFFAPDGDEQKSSSENRVEKTEQDSDEATDVVPSASIPYLAIRTAIVECGVFDVVEGAFRIGEICKLLVGDTKTGKKRGDWWEMRILPEQQPARCADDIYAFAKWLKTKGDFTIGRADTIQNYWLQWRTKGISSEKPPIERSEEEIEQLKNWKISAEEIDQIRAELSITPASQGKGLPADWGGKFQRRDYHK